MAHTIMPAIPCNPLQSPLPFLLVLQVSRPGSLASTSQLKEPANVFDDRSMLDNDKQGHRCAGRQVRSCLSMLQNTEWKNLAANFLLGTFQALMVGWSL